MRHDELYMGPSGDGCERGRVEGTLCAKNRSHLRLLSMWGISAISLLCVAVGLVVIGTSSGPEPLSCEQSGLLVGGDTYIGWGFQSCDTQNHFAGMCTTVGNACVKCDNSSGGRLVTAGGQGWKVSGAYVCGPVALGTCDGSLNCSGPYRYGSSTCTDLTLVIPQ